MKSDKIHSQQNPNTCVMKLFNVEVIIAADYPKLGVSVRHKILLKMQHQQCKKADSVFNKDKLLLLSQRMWNK